MKDWTGTPQLKTLRREIVKDLGVARDLVWLRRLRLSEDWPTPTPVDSADFAITEFGEYVDAHLRENPEYNRNNGKTRESLDELADMAMMLLTFVGPAYEFRSTTAGYVSLTENIDDLYTFCKIAMGEFAASFHSERVQRNRAQLALMTAGFIFHASGFKLSDRVAARLDRIEARVLHELQN